MPEALKPLDSILRPDPRFEGYVIRESGTGDTRPVTVADHHRWIANSMLGEDVPDDIRQAFWLGQNLTLYAWFVYPFLASAQMHFAGCIEHAFRVKLGLDHDWSAKHGLGDLLKRARRARLLEGVTFQDAQTEGWIPGPGTAMSHEDWFFDRVAEILRIIRNALAHGRPMLLPDGGMFMRLTADTINHLFRPTRGT